MRNHHPAVTRQPYTFSKYMRRIHIALAISDLDDAIADIRSRLGVAPCVVVPDAYALFRTTSVNLSLTVNTEQAGQLRHLGIEDPKAKAFVTESGPDGFIWERFTAEQQADEINTYWPQANYTPDKS